MRKAPWLLPVLGILLLGAVATACGQEKPASTTTPGSTATSGAPGAPVTGAGPGEPAAAGGLPQGIPVALPSSSGQQTGIWVTGSGRVTVQPQIATLTLGVEARAATVEEARSRAAEAMNRIVSSLKANGVEDKDIQTRLFNITPQYVFRERTESGVRTSEQVLVGYTVSNQASVRIRSLDKVGKVIDDVAKAGGDLTRIQGVRFSVDDFTPQQTQAREQAVKEAQAKARQFATLTGVTLGRLVYITETSTTPVAAQEVTSRVALAAEAPTPVSPGELEVRVTVQAVFAIQ